MIFDFLRTNCFYSEIFLRNKFFCKHLKINNLNGKFRKSRRSKLNSKNLFTDESKTTSYQATLNRGS